MSFSSNIKEELSKISNLNKKEEVKYELIGYLISKNSTNINNKIRYATESDYNINRFCKLLKNLNLQHDIQIEGKSFVVTIKNKDINFIKDIKVINNYIEIDYINIDILNEFEKRAIIRGSFLGAGSINNPEKKYHLEINLSSEKNLKFIIRVLEKFNINIKILEQQNKTTIYIKEADEISKLLALMEANSSVLKFEDIRIQREMRGKVNRLVNCQTANLNKTINASVEQIEAIKKIQKENKFNKLDNNLKEIALLRLKNPDMPLKELGGILKNPVGKSGVNYRLKKIIQIAKDL